VRSGDRFGCLWSGPNAWGTIDIGEGAATLTVLGGTLALVTLGLALGGGESVAVELDGRRIEAFVAGDTLRFGEHLRLGAGATLTVRAPALSVRSLPDTDEIERAARSARAADEGPAIEAAPLAEAAGVAR
jgi:hypothetical protein